MLQLFIRDCVEVCSLWDELSQEHVEVFDGSFLPGMIWKAEVSLYAHLIPQLVVKSILFSIVVRNGSSEFSWNIFENIFCFREHTYCRWSSESSDACISCSSFYEGSDKLLVCFSNNRICFPISNTFSLVDDIRSLINHHSILNAILLMDSFLLSVSVPFALSS